MLKSVAYVTIFATWAGIVGALVFATIAACVIG